MRVSYFDNMQVFTTLTNHKLLGALAGNNEDVLERGVAIMEISCLID